MEKKLNKSHKAILAALQEHGSLTMLELHLITGLSKDGIRGRLSELRKMGFATKLCAVTAKKYVIEREAPEQEILNWVEKNGKYDEKILYSTLSKELDLPREQIVEGMAELYRAGRLLQVSNSTVKIRRER